MTTKITSDPSGTFGSLYVGATEVIRIRQDGSSVIVLTNYADDTAAAAGGIPIGGLYRTGATVKARTV